MNMLNNLLFSNPFLMNIWLDDAKSGKTVKGFDNILEMMVYIGGTVIAVLLIIGIIKAALEYSKGSGSGGIGKIIGMVIFLIFCLGMMVLAKNWGTLQSVGGTIANNGLEIVNDFAGQIGGTTQGG